MQLGDSLSRSLSAQTPTSISTYTDIGMQCARAREDRRMRHIWFSTFCILICTLLADQFSRMFYAAFPGRRAKSWCLHQIRASAEYSPAPGTTCTISNRRSSPPVIFELFLREVYQIQPAYGLSALGFSKLSESFVASLLGVFGYIYVLYSMYVLYIPTTREGSRFLISPVTGSSQRLVAFLASDNIHPQSSRLCEAECQFCMMALIVCQPYTSVEGYSTRQSCKSHGLPKRRNYHL